MARTFILLLLLVVSALLLVTSRHQTRKLFIELEHERQLAQRYQEEYSRLQLEQSTWSVPNRIDGLARDKLEMQLPEPNQIRVIAYEERKNIRTEGAQP